MTQGSKQIETYYTIKVGNAFVKEIKIGGGFSNQKVYLKELSLTQYEADIKKWCFDSLASAGTEDGQRQEKYFKEVLELLKDNGMTYEVLKTTVETTEEQNEVMFVDGKEKNNRKGFSEGGSVRSSGRIAVLHNDFVLNKEDAEKLFQSAGESATLFGKSISEVMDSYVEFAKQGYKDEKVLNKVETEDLSKLVDFLTDAAMTGKIVGDIIETLKKLSK